MWFTRVSLQEPGFCHHGHAGHCGSGPIFSYQRLKVDQFPNIDFPTVVVVTTEYPGASPEIMSKVKSAKKIEEGRQCTVAGINALTSRSYEGSSVVIIEFNLDVDGRKAAEDVREKVALMRPNLRDEVKDPRISALRPCRARPSSTWPSSRKTARRARKS